MGKASQTFLSEKERFEIQNYYALSEFGFRLFAPIYDSFFVFLSFGIELELRDKVAAVANAKRKHKILDLATGTGRQAFAFANRGSFVVGVDLSKDMIAVAQKKKNKYQNLLFERADATNLPFKNRSFDISCISFGMHDMIPTIRERAMRELTRVTKENGTIIVVDYASPPRNILVRLFSNVFKFFEPYYSEFLHYDLEDLITKSGIQIERRIPVFYGLGRILDGKKL